MQQRLTDLLPAPYFGATRQIGEFVTLSGSTAAYTTFADATDTALVRKDYLVSYVKAKADLVNGKVPVTQLPPATTAALGAVKIGSGLNVDATGLLTATVTLTADQLASLKPYVVSYDKLYGYDNLASALSFANNLGDLCAVQYNTYGLLSQGITMNQAIFFMGGGNQLRFANNITLTIGQFASGTRFRDCYIVLNTDSKISIASGGIEYTCTSFDNVVTGGSNSSVEVVAGGILALRGNSNLHKVTGSGTVYLFDHCRINQVDSTITIIDRRTANTPPLATVKAAVAASGNTWSNGELQGAQPAGSMVGMRFVDANYRYEYMSGMNDTNGTSYAWTRTVKA